MIDLAIATCVEMLEINGIVIIITGRGKTLKKMHGHSRHNIQAYGLPDAGSSRLNVQRG